VSTQHRMTRRRFVALSSAAVIGVLAGCKTPEPTPVAEVKPTEKPAAPTAAPAQPTAVPPTAAPKPTAVPPTAAPKATSAPAAAASKYQEAPAFAELVKAGKLPPVDQRLPENPLVIPRKGGKYGGTMRMATTDKDPFTWTTRGNGAMQGIPMRLSEDLSGVVPNLFEDCVYSDDKRVIHCKMRKGAKFSNGMEHTADDWVFWRDYIQNDPRVTPAPFSYYTSGGELMQIKKIDKYTFDIIFKEPKPFFVLQCFAHCLGFWGSHALPVEWMKQFHIDFNPDADKQAKAEGWEDWGKRMFFEAKGEDSAGPDKPMDGAYHITSIQPDAVHMSRNPYYWAVDQDGRQLPYMDGLLEEKLANDQIIQAKALAGELDRQGFPFKDYETFAAGQEKGGYVIYDWTQLQNARVFSFNQNWTDPVWQKIFRDKRFRQAMSVALNREEMNQVAYAGVATPSQFTCHPSHPAYKPEYSTAWAQYDPDLANKMLDEIGLKWDAKHELRTLPDGRPAEISTLFWSAYVDQLLELAVANWLAVGIKINYKSVERSFTHDATLANELPMSTWSGDEVGMVLLGSRPKWLVAPYTDENALAPLWGKWYETKVKEGEEPPAEVKELYEAHDMYSTTGDLQYIGKLLASNAENLWTMGTLVDIPNPLMANKNLRGLPKEKPDGWDTNGPQHIYPEAWWLDV